MWMSAEHSDQKEIDYSQLQSFSDLIIGCIFFFFCQSCKKTHKPTTEKKIDHFIAVSQTTHNPS